MNILTKIDRIEKSFEAVHLLDLFILFFFNSWIQTKNEEYINNYMTSYLEGATPTKFGPRPLKRERGPSFSKINLCTKRIIGHFARNRFSFLILTSFTMSFNKFLLVACFASLEALSNINTKKKYSEFDAASSFFRFLTHPNMCLSLSDECMT